ncbi:MAG: hypothetical protein WC702_03335 [Patescibacteria group bacterium]|jgi:hypothetical protein
MKIISETKNKWYIISAVLFLVFCVSGILGITLQVFASATTSLTQTINSGTLSVDIVDASFVTVASPTVALGSASFSFSCQTTTGTFGTASQKIYVSNPDAADGGWSVSLAASDPTNVWDSAGTDFDFNDPTTSGCADGADADSVGGQLTVDPSVGTLAVGECASCVVTNVSLGASASFSEGAVNSITILSGTAASNDIGDWTAIGVSLSQTIPAEQPAASDYDINLVLSIIASS